MQAIVAPNRSFFGLLLALSGGTVLALGLASCADTQSGPARDGMSGAAVHAVHSDELQSAMRDLNYRTKEEIAAEIYTGSPTRADMNDLVESAAALARSAEKIPGILDRVNMAPEDRRAFLAINNQLIQHARALRTDAKGGNVAAARQTMKRIDATCDACHNQFRFSVGE